jgi:hypothetical protein
LDLVQQYLRQLRPWISAATHCDKLLCWLKSVGFKIWKCFWEKAEAEPRDVDH